MLMPEQRPLMNRLSRERERENGDGEGELKGDKQKDHREKKKVERIWKYKDERMLQCFLL